MTETSLPTAHDIVGRLRAEIPDLPGIIFECSGGNVWTIFIGDPEFAVGPFYSDGVAAEEAIYIGEDAVAATTLAEVAVAVRAELSLTDVAADGVVVARTRRIDL